MTLPIAERPSLLAPITVGLCTDLDPTDVLASAWSAAFNSVPLTQPQRNVMVQEGKRRVAKPFRHTSTLVDGSSDEYPWQARLCYGLPSVSGPDRWDNWVWKTGARIVTDSASAVEGAAATVRLDTTGYRLRAGRIQSAAELALFRHYLVSGLQAIDAGAILPGDNHGWDDTWWQVSTS